VSRPDSAASPTHRRRVHARVALARTPRRFPGLFKATPPPWTPHPSPSRHPIVLRRRPETLAAVAVGLPTLPLSRHREAGQDLRQEVTNPPASLVDVLARRSALEPSPDFAALTESRRRVVRPRRRVSAVTAALVGFAALHAARRCLPRAESSSGCNNPGI
jgi:hypothetical protein